MTPQHVLDRNLAHLYTHFTGDVAPVADIRAALLHQPRRRQRAIWFRARDWTWAAIGAELHLPRASAHSLARRAMRSIWKELLRLRRYHNLGHPPPVRRSGHGKAAERPT